MKLPALVTSGEHTIEDAPPGVAFDGRTRELHLGDELPGGRFPVRLVGRGGGVEITMPLTIAKDATPAPEPAPAPKRRRATTRKR